MSTMSTCGGEESGGRTIAGDFREAWRFQISRLVLDGPKERGVRGDTR